MAKCKQCLGNDVIRNGYTPSGTQRYKCKSCGNRFVLNAEHAIDVRVSANSKKARALREAGFSLRKIGAVLGVNHQTVANLQIDNPCVYIVKVGHFYKIGKTRNIKQRLAALSSYYKTNCKLIHIHECDYHAVEKKMHEMFASYHLGNELFEFSKFELEVVKQELMKM